MNLHDVVKRSDPALEVVGRVEAIELKRPGGGQRGIRLTRESTARLKDAHLVAALRHFPSHPGWVVETERGGDFEVRLVAQGGGARLFASSGAANEKVTLLWPVPVPARFDLELAASGGTAEVLVGPLFNARHRLLPWLLGEGVEIGPGLSPAVLPHAGRTVRYVEKKSVEAWMATYGKRDVTDQTSQLWQHYIIDSAHELKGFADASLDFIFSSHVVEHLVNPLQVFRNWWRTLRSGGIIAGVVPDARYSFDLRQPLSTLEDFLRQERAANFETTSQMYDKWCRFTAPYNTPDSLRQRDYAIHVNYFSPESFRDFLGLFAEHTPVAGIFIESAQNAKDFGFLISKP